MKNQSLEQNLIERVAMGDMLRRRSRGAGNRSAIVGFNELGRHEISYRELNNKSNQLVHGLREQGLVQGDSLALLATNSIEFFIVLFACYKAGIVLVPINFLQSPADIEYNLQIAKVKAIVCESRFTPLTASAKLEHIKLRILITSNNATNCDNNKDNNHDDAGENTSNSSLNLNQLIAAQHDSEIEDIIINDRDTAQIIFSSGTTSKAKGIETSHLSLYMSSLNTPLSLEFGKFHNHLAVLPTFHCASLSFCLTTLQTGGKLCLIPAFDPLSVAKIIKDEQVLSTGLLPIMWKAMLAHPELPTFDFSSLTIGLYAMALIDGETLQKLRDTFSSCKFHLGSGQSEYTPCATIFYDGSATEFAQGNYWGVPTAISDQAIIDEQGNEVPQGQQGEICWRGPQVMSRYLDDEESSREASKFGWHHTGDLGLIDSEGQLLFVDRKKDMIKSGGENVASMKVEQVLLSLPNIVQVAVFGLPHEQWSEAVCAGVQVTPNSDFNESDIIAQCKKKLAGFEVPKRVLLLNEFPLTSTGKIQKNALREQYKKLFS